MATQDDVRIISERILQGENSILRSSVTITSISLAFLLVTDVLFRFNPIVLLAISSAGILSLTSGLWSLSRIIILTYVPLRTVFWPPKSIVLYFFTLLMLGFGYYSVATVVIRFVVAVGFVGLGEIGEGLLEEYITPTPTLPPTEIVTPNSPGG